MTARGCATKDSVFHIECENHVMGAGSEKFCYCSYFLCNGSSGRRQLAPQGVLSWVLVLFGPRIFVRY